MVNQQKVKEKVFINPLNKRRQANVRNLQYRLLKKRNEWLENLILFTEKKI